MKLSVIIPVYNVAPWIRACLDSIACAIESSGFERCSGFEVICVDDGSTDGSLRILEKFGDELSARGARVEGGLRVVVVHQENRGVGAARNAGLEAATGEWVMFVDGDDVIAPGTIWRIAEALRVEGDADIVRFGLCSFDGRTSPDWGSESPSKPVRLIDLAHELRTESVSGWFVQRVYRRKLIEKVRFPDLKNGEDTVFLWRAVFGARKEVVLSDCLYGYRQRKDSASHGAYARVNLESLLSAFAMLAEILSKCSRPVNANVFRSVVNNVSEPLAFDMMRLSRLERKAFFGRLLETWRHVAQMRSFPWWQRIRFQVIGLLPFRFFALLLFAFPHWLKKKGIHRR